MTQTRTAPLGRPTWLDLLGSVRVAPDEDRVGGQGASGLGGLLGVPAWLMVVSGVALLIGGAIELRCMRSRPVATYMRLMVAYDSGWALATLAGLLLAWQGSAAGGEVWITYQAVAVIAFAAFLLAATPVRPASA